MFCIYIYFLISIKIILYFNNSISRFFRNILPLYWNRDDIKKEKKKRKPESIIRNRKEEERAIQFLYRNLSFSLSEYFYFTTKLSIFTYFTSIFPDWNSQRIAKFFLHRSRYIETRLLDNFIYTNYIAAPLPLERRTCTRARVF